MAVRHCRRKVGHGEAERVALRRRDCTLTRGSEKWFESGKSRLASVVRAFASFPSEGTGFPVGASIRHGGLFLGLGMF